MATVQGLTATRMQELAAGWTDVDANQTDTDVVVNGLKISQETFNALFTTFLNATLPQLLEALAGNEIRLDDLNDNVIPDFQNWLDALELAIENLQTVTLPELEQELNNEVEGNAARPKVYTQPDEPENPDIDDRDLIVGDVWFDSDDDMKMRLWNGTEWSLMDVDTEMLAEIVRNNVSPNHTFFVSPVDGQINTGVGVNITSP